MLVALNNMQKLHFLASVFGHMYVYLPQCQCQLLLWSDGFPEVCVFFPYQWIYFVQNFIELMS